MKKGIAFLVGLILLLPSLFVLAQDSSATTLEITGANASDLPTITITANVLDSSSRPVIGLTEADFTLTGSLSEVAEIVRVENITTDDLPFATVLVIDVSSSMSGLPIAQAKIAARQFVESIGANDPVAIVTFGSEARLALDYTTDKSLLLQTIDNLAVGGRTALYDAAVLGIEVAADAPIPRRAVILLSDGAEYGGLSRNLRGAAIERAIANGVSVYTIGLGFGIDRTYLQEVSAGSNARNYESPDAEELTTIYGELASLFRSQYVITLNAPDAEFDGTVYDFTLQAGNSNEASSEVRMPIPVPIVRLPDSLFEEEIIASVTVTPEILADDEIASVEVLLNGEAIALDESGSIVIDPTIFAPGAYTLAVRAIDVDGDSGADEGEFVVGAVASSVTFDQTFGDEPITEPQTVTITTSGQTPTVNAVYGLVSDTSTNVSPPTTDADNGFPFILDPFNYAPGNYTLRVDVTNEGGVTSTATQPVNIGSVAPRDIVITGIDAGTEISEPMTIGVEADTQPGTEITSIEVLLPDGTDISEDLTINPAILPEGDIELTVTVTDTYGNSTTETAIVTIAALAPLVTFGDVPGVISVPIGVQVDVNSQSPVTEASYSFDDGEATPLTASGEGYLPITIDPATLEDGEHTLTVTATNQAGLTGSESVTFTIANPTPTADAPGTLAAQSTADAQATTDALVLATNAAQATTDAQTTVDAQSTSDAQATVDANEQATSAAQNTADANQEATANAQATQDAAATTTSQAETAQAEVDEQETIEANATNVANNFATREAGGTATANVAATTDAQATNDAEATLESETVILQQTTDAQATTDAEATLDAQATADAEGTLNAQSTADAQATNNAAATDNAIATAEQGTQVAEANVSDTPTDAPTTAPTIAPTDTATAEASLEATATFTTAPTLTPIGEIIEEDPSQTPPISGVNALLLCGGGLLVMLILFFIFRRGRSSN